MSHPPGGNKWSRPRRDRQRMESRFRRAPFPLFGLPPGWEGERFLGPARWFRSRGRRTIQSLSLVHGVLLERGGSTLVVEMAHPDQPGGGGSLRVFAEELWTGRPDRGDPLVLVAESNDGGHLKPPVRFILSCVGASPTGPPRRRGHSDQPRFPHPASPSGPGITGTAQTPLASCARSRSCPARQILLRARKRSTHKTLLRRHLRSSGPRQEAHAKLRTSGAVGGGGACQE